MWICCNSCEEAVNEDNSRKRVCTKCPFDFCGQCSRRLFPNEQLTCLRCQFADNLLGNDFNPNHLDLFNLRDIRRVLWQHKIDYNFNSNKDQLINVLDSFLANQGRRTKTRQSPDEEDLEDDSDDSDDSDSDDDEEDEEEEDELEEEDDEDELEEDVQEDLNENQVSMDLDENNSSSGNIADNSNATDKHSEIENHQCKICFGGPANYVFIACGHVMACDKCAPLFKDCPFCRQKITSSIKIFFP